jgi:hypothetical protein
MADVKVVVRSIDQGSGNIKKVSKALDGLGTSADKAGIKAAALNRKQSQLAKQVAKGNLTVDQASAKYRKFADSLGNTGRAADGGGKQVASFGDQLKNAGKFAAIAVGSVVAFGVAAKKAFDLGKEGAQIAQLEESFNRMNASVFKTPGLLDKMREATRGTVSDAQLMSGLLTLTAGATDELAVAMAQASPRLLEIAKASNKLNPTLGDTAFLYESLAKGIKRSSPLILDNLGIVIKIEAANKKYADSLGKTVAELSATEKQMALLNAVLESGDTLIRQVGGDVDSATDSFGKFETQLKNIADETKRSAAEGIGPMVGFLNDILPSITKINRILAVGGLSGLAEMFIFNPDFLKDVEDAEVALLDIAIAAGDADRKFSFAAETIEDTNTALTGQARTNAQAARVMAATEKATKDLADRQKFLEETTGEATKAIEEEAAALRQLKLDAFTSALEDTGEPLKFFNETLDELGPQMVLFGGRTADQNRILGEARDKYKDLDRAIVDLSIGLDGLGLSEEERGEKLGELIEQQQQLLPLISDLESVQSSANMVVQEATINEEALNRELYNQVAALSDDAEQLALTAGALGLYNEEQLRAALQAAALEEATALAAKAIAQEGVDANLAFEALLDFAQGNADSFEAALTHRQELENLNAQLDEIPGTYEAEIRAETAQAEAALERVRRAAIEASKDRTATITIRTINLTEHRESVRGSIPGATGRQHGGPVLAGNPYIVGERGPELFVPAQSGQIIPNNQLDIGGMTVNVNVSSGNPAVIGREVAGTVANELGNMMRG